MAFASILTAIKEKIKELPISPLPVETGQTIQATIISPYVGEYIKTGEIYEYNCNIKLTQNNYETIIESAKLLGGKFLIETKKAAKMPGGGLARHQVTVLDKIDLSEVNKIFSQNIPHENIFYRLNIQVTQDNISRIGLVLFNNYGGTFDKITVLYYKKTGAQKSTKTSNIKLSEVSEGMQKTFEIKLETALPVVTTQLTTSEPAITPFTKSESETEPVQAGFGGPSLIMFILFGLLAFAFSKRR